MQKFQENTCFLLVKFCMVLALIAVNGNGHAKKLGSNKNQEEIISASVVFRHGDRNIFYTYPRDPYKNVNVFWPRGLGQLTKRGEERQYELGSYLRRRWKSFLPKIYNYKDIYVRSTNISRTVASAHFNLMGLYHANKETQNNIHMHVLYTWDVNNDTLLFPRVSCEKYKRLHKALKQSDQYKCIKNTMKGIAQKIRLYADLKESDPYVYLYDTFLIESQNNLELPGWTRYFYPEPLRSLYMLELFTSYAANKDLQRLAVGPLIKEIISNMQRKVNKTLDPDYKVFFYSAHDVTLADILQALKVYNDLLVPYSAAVIIELRRSNNKGYYVTVSYRNETGKDAHLLQIPGCDAYCPLNTFVKLTKNIIPDDQECTEEVPKNYQKNFPVPSSNLLPGWSQCFDKTNSLVTRSERYKFFSISGRKMKLQGITETDESDFIHHF